MSTPFAWSIASFFLLACGWLSWLYVFTYRQLLQSNRDRDRLIRRLGQYHSLPLAFPSPDAPSPSYSLPPDAVVPPAFRMKRPSPPLGWRGPQKGDL